MIKKIIQKIKSSSAGFTLIEAIVAMLIITMGLVPALYTTNSATRISENIERNLTAAHLVQEGIEVIRYLRDRNRLLCDDFSTGLLGTWIVEYDDDWVSCASRNLVPASGTPPVLLKDASGRFNYSSGTNTLYTRVITVTEIVPNVELRVISTVSWPARSTKAGCQPNTHCVTAEGHLFNWLQ